VGDVMLGRGVARSLQGDWEAAFAEVAPVLGRAELVFGNLESPLTTAPQVSEGHDLRAPPGAVGALTAAGFDWVSVANNHALDAGEAGLAETERVLAGEGLAGLGAGEHRCSPPVCVLALDDSAAPLDAETVAAGIAALAGDADLVVVSIHWGGEVQAAPSPRQLALARAFVDAGADLVVGHGPHVLQRVDQVDDAPVAFSLGNFLFDQPYPADCRQGAILLVTACGGRVCGVEAFPTVVERGRVRPAGGQVAAAIRDRLDLP
jgi:poly-gamma-glutamate capsule biosynthesis protein CapA/YwtB (metallophosphatase superfamily)